MRRLIPLIAAVLAVSAIAATKNLESRKLATARAMVEDRLKDAESAKFKDVTLRNNDTYLCGRVNAKTSGGGYAGFQRFYVKIEEKKVLFEDDDYFYEQTWRQFCE